MSGFNPVLSALEWWYAVPAPDRRPRDREMKILALGAPRTGTESLKKALEILGYDKVYHNWEAVEDPTHYVFWREAMKAKFGGGKKFTRDDWDRMLGDCQAVTDFPCTLFARELIAAYPEAKIILSTRDVDSWHHSVSSTIINEMYNTPRKIVGLFHPLFFQFFTLYRMGELYFTDDFKNKGKAMMEDYNAMIRGSVPEEGRLLEYHVSQGWEPLCEFLGVPIPDVPVPKGNFGEDFAKKVAGMTHKRLMEAVWNMGMVLGGLGVVVAAVVWGVRMRG